MRIISTTVYNFDELSPEGQQNAVNNYLNSDRDTYFWFDDNIKTLESFANIFNIKIKDWTQDLYHTDVRYTCNNDDNIMELSGIRLLKYIFNNYYTDIYKGKYYYNKGKKRYSRVLKENCCVLTGYCIDDDILQPIYDFIKNPDDSITFKSLIHECIESWITAVKNDIEGCQSFEYVSDHLIANEYEFDKQGNII